MDEKQPRDWRELVGFLREPLPKLKREERALVRKALADDVSKLDPPVGLRMALSSGARIHPEWLQPRVVDLALGTNDIARHFEKLITARKTIDAALVAEVLGRRIENSPLVVLQVLRKAAIPKKNTRKFVPQPIVDDQSAQQFLKIVLYLTPQLLGGELSQKKRRIGQDLLEVVSTLASPTKQSELAGKALEFLRILERYIGWTDLEKEPLRQMRESIVELPARLLPEVLARGCIIEASDLKRKAALIDAADQAFLKTLEEISEAGYGEKLPQISRSWIHQMLRQDEAESHSSISLTDAGVERLALVLINTWESKDEGINAQHAYSIAEEIFRTGFNLFLTGTVGDTVKFDPDIHEALVPLRRSEECRLIRPWVEWRNVEGLKVLLKAKVLPVTDQESARSV